MARKLTPRAQQLGMAFEAAIHEGEAFAFDIRLGDGLVVIFLELGFELKEFELAGAARHEEENHIARARGEMPWFGPERIGWLEIG